ncbi:MAG: lysoplasmalogenase [Oscillospiraceae bacterium]
MQAILICLFAAASLTNIVACASDRQSLRKFSKLLLMPLLLGAYLLSSPETSGLVVFALIFGWGGDIFMIFKSDERLLSAGIGSFGIGHLLYLAAMIKLMGTPTVFALVALPLIFAVGGVIFFLQIRPLIDKKLRVPSLFYSLLLSTLGAVAALLLTVGAKGGVPLLAGALCFILSDGILALEIFKNGDSPKQDFAVMLTYLSAQALLICGFCM